MAAPKVALFITCLVDLMRPSIGFAAIRLLESGGAGVYVPPSQTCCGQPGYNSGDRKGAIALATKLVAEFEACDYLVAPSGSCSGPTGWPTTSNGVTAISLVSRPTTRITHAYFGPLPCFTTLRLLSAHTRHHVRGAAAAGRSAIAVP